MTGTGTKTYFLTVRTLSLGLGKKMPPTSGTRRPSRRQAERVPSSRPRILRSEEQGLVKKTEEFLQKTTTSPCVVFHSTTEDE